MKRTAFQQAYADANPTCEVHAILRKHRSSVAYVGRQFQDVLATRETPAGVAVHHIFHNNRQRVDNRTNVISVCHTIHRLYYHGTMPYEPDNKLVAFHVKFIKGELNLDEFNEASGFALLGWLMMNEPNQKHWTRRFWEELVAFAEAQA